MRSRRRPRNHTGRRNTRADRSPRHSPRRPADQLDPSGARGRHAQHVRSSRRELLAAADRLHDQRQARPGHPHYYRQRNDHGAQQQSAGPQRHLPEAGSQHLSPARHARIVHTGETTEGMVVTRIAVDGEAIDLAAAPQGAAAASHGVLPPPASIPPWRASRLAKPIAAKSKADASRSRGGRNCRAAAAGAATA